MNSLFNVVAADKTSAFSALMKQTLSTVERQIDKVLDIQAPGNGNANNPQFIMDDPVMMTMQQVAPAVAKQPDTGADVIKEERSGKDEGEQAFVVSESSDQPTVRNASRGVLVSPAPKAPLPIDDQQPSQIENQTVESTSDVDLAAASTAVTAVTLATPAPVAKPAEPTPAASHSEKDALIEMFKTMIRQQAESLQEKEQQVQDLMREGEKLSELNGRITQAAKKLKSKTDEQQETIQLLEKRFIDSKNECADLTSRLDRHVESEKKYLDSIKALKDQTESSQSRMLKLETELTATKEESSRLQGSLDRAWQEVSDLRNQNASAITLAQSNALEKEQLQSKELKMQIDVLREQKEAEMMSLNKEIFDLRAALNRSENEAAWKDDNHRKELSTLQSRILEIENRSEELAATAQEANRPLIRQIETLQSQAVAAQRAWESVERSLNQRLQKAEEERSSAIEAKSMALGKLSDLQTRIGSLESALSAERREKVRICDEIEKSKNELLRMAELEATLESMQRSSQAALAKLEASHQTALVKAVEQERSEWSPRVEMQKQRVAELEGEIQKLQARLETAASQHQQGNNWARDDSTGISNTTPSSGSVLPASPVYMDLQISSLRDQLRSLTTVKDELSNEIVKLTIENTSLRPLVDRLSLFESQYTELKERHQTTLIMLGEKSERVEELQNDIDDMKTAYREQIQELIQRLGD